MKLSIITINLNNREGLERTIQSVVSQTFTDFEYIIIDGGSTDGSVDVINEYADKITYWVSESDKGIYNAMNKGILKAKGKYINFLNSGDWYVNSMSLFNVFNSASDSDIMFGNQYIIKNGQILEQRRYSDKLSFRYLYDMSIGHNVSFIKTKLFHDNLYNETYHIVSDWEFFIKQALVNTSFVHIDEFIAFFDYTGISSTDFDLLNQERYDVLERTIPECIRNDIKEQDAQKISEDKQLQKIIEYRSKNRIYKKALTLTLQIFELFKKKQL